MNADVLRALRGKHQRQSGALYGDGSALAYAGVTGKAMDSAADRLGAVQKMIDERRKYEAQLAKDKLANALANKKLKAEEARTRYLDAKTKEIGAKSRRERDGALRERNLEALEKDPGRVEVGREEYDRNLGGMLAASGAGATGTEAGSAANRATAKRRALARELGLKETEARQKSEKHGDRRAEDEVAAMAATIVREYADADDTDRNDALDAAATDLGDRLGVGYRRAFNLLRGEVNRQRMELEEAEKGRAAKVRAAKAGNPRGYGLDRKTASEIADLDTMIDRMAAMAREKQDFNTGPFISRMSKLVEAVDMAPERAAFRARVGAVLSEYMKAISGAAISEKEAARLMANLPNINDDDETFMRKLDVAMEDAQRLRANKLRARGKDPARRPGADAGADAGPDLTPSVKVRRKEDGAVRMVAPGLAKRLTATGRFEVVE